MSEYKTEEEQVEALKRWWEANGKFVIIGGIIILSSIIGQQVWSNFKLSTLTKASAQYGVLMEELETKKFDSVLQRGETLIKSNSDLPYAVLAALAMAKVHVEQGDNSAAAERLQWALNNAKQEEVQHISRIRLAKVLMAQGKLDDALSLINHPQQGDFRSQYTIVKGDVYYKKGEIGSAKTAYRSALDDSSLGSQIRGFIQIKLDDLGGSGDGA